MTASAMPPSRTAAGAPAGTAISASPPGSPTSSTRCSATSWGSVAASGGASNRGNDLRYNLEITLEDAFKGKQTAIRVATLAPCEACSGTGAAPDSRPVSCPTCHGSGRVRAQQGFFTIERTCPSCQRRRAG